MERHIFTLLAITFMIMSCAELREKTTRNEALYSEIDSKAKIKLDSLIDYQEISSYITQGLDDPEDRIRAIYIWITHNISYDVSQADTLKFRSDEKLLRAMMGERSGVCYHYSKLFHAMCQSAGIESYIINGYTQNEKGVIADESHAWNAVVVDSSYYLIDATWDAGYVEKGAFVPDFKANHFLVEPKEFIKTHIPFDYLWQFLEPPISPKEFGKQEFSKLKTVQNSSFYDSIVRHSKLDSLSALLAQQNRILKSSARNVHIENQLVYLDKSIQTIRYNAWVEEYNDLIQNLSLARVEFNKMVALSNRFIAFVKKSNSPSENEEIAMKAVASDAIKYYRNAKRLLAKTKSKVSLLAYTGEKQEQIAYCLRKKKRSQSRIEALESKLLAIKPSLKLAALYADIELEK